MKKKLVFMLVGLVVTMAANAQFEQGKKYIGSSLSGLNLSYNGTEKSSLGLQAKAGYLFSEDFMITGQVGYDKKKDVPAAYTLGAGARYYIVQNGLYLGASVNYLHSNNNYDDFMPSLQVGYAFFISHTVTIEPEIYYNQSFKSHSDYSTVGFRVGFGIYL
jgi:hypothetical protein